MTLPINMCVITESAKLSKHDVNFVGNKEFLINCIFHLIKIYKEDFETKDVEE